MGSELRVPEEGRNPVPKGPRYWPIDADLELILFLAQITGGDPSPGETHDEARWLSVDELSSVDWLPADSAALPTLVESLRAP